ncbi:hypothetical protein DFJ74DRAFT_693518 [Hyaloraphidium curvatum]|nr:hypothetical protein DFJ74DRAFT_693518 [Hyaloraphidium curvatum]
MPDGSAAPPAATLASGVEAYIPQALKGAVFVGHLATDLDSIAGAIGAAELYGGVAARASEINGETAFSLQKWGVEQPPPIEDVLKENASANICLVDFQQTSQMNKAIDPEKVVGIIDHHALQSSTIEISRPIHIDIRPWGSMSTILAHTFLTLGRTPQRSTAGLLLGAILSDTLDRRGPTTTEWDRKMVDVLAGILDMSEAEVAEMAKGQFKAKSAELAALPAHQLVGMDQKSFGFETEAFKGNVGFAVIETVDVGPHLERAADLIEAVRKDKADKKLDALMLAVVDIVGLNATLLLCDDAERSLAAAAFGKGKVEASSLKETMDLPGLVSRKKDFVPAVDKAIKGGWAPAAKA